MAEEKDFQERETRLRFVEAAGGIGIFELDPGSGTWEWSAQVAQLFGIDPAQADRTFAFWEKLIFFDDLPKIRAALAQMPESETFDVEFRVTHPDGSLRWLAARGHVIRPDGAAFVVRGAINDITERKA